jgi:hypothetical protein
MGHVPNFPLHSQCDTASNKQTSLFRFNVYILLGTNAIDISEEEIPSILS